MRVAVLQSNYLPWRGYFDIIHDVDLFVFYDDVQYTKNDWRNRNRVKTASGVQWLTIPTGSNFDRRICDVPLPDGNWRSKHWKTIEQCYGATPYWKHYETSLKCAYDSAIASLSEFNQHLIRLVCRWLGIKTLLVDSRKYRLEGSRQDRLLMLLKECGATEYVSGPSARAYIDPEAFDRAGIKLTFKTYDYPEYPQRYGRFEPSVTVLDLLFNTGARAPSYIW